MKKTGLLVLAYGGPDSLDEIEPYLLDVRGGRPTSPELVEEIRARYAAIGGRSPLLEVTRQQATALAEALNERFPGERVFEPFVGMRHWRPRIGEAVAAMQAAGIQQAVALVMAPHYSGMSIGKYAQILQGAIQEQAPALRVDLISSWHNHPGLIEAIAEKARQRLQSFEPERPFVLFTAHSLPSRILKEQDPYVDQLHETARLVAATLEMRPEEWRFCFQSAGRSPEPWLGPQIEEVIPKLGEEGHRNMLVVPVGFVADHVEVLYDIDIEAAHLARQHGLRLERSPSLNASPALISALAGIVAERIQNPLGKAEA